MIHQCLSQATQGLKLRTPGSYERVARNPNGAFDFHRGHQYALRILGYPSDELQGLPALAVNRFAGVGNPFAAGGPRPGETVLDLGCGAGTDLLIAARRVGTGGRVIGIDGSPSMCRCAEMAARAAGLADRIEVREGRLDVLPVPDGSVDCVIGNGILGSSQRRERIFREVRRVLKEGGRLYLADLVVSRTPGQGEPAALQWAAWLAGAPVEDELPELARRAGLKEVRTLACWDCLRHAPVAQAWHPEVKVHGVTLTAVKGVDPS
jgi:SAM-dependent methyltransferase